MKKAAMVIHLFLFCFAALAAKSQSVYKTPSGHSYHLSTCSMVRNVSAEISIEEARQIGLQPCKICNPMNIGSAPSPHKAQGQHNTAQCLGYTKAGNRCRHMTSIGNGYCYQHQPQ